VKEDQDKLRGMLENKELIVKNLIKEACNKKIEEFNQNTRILNKEEIKKGEENSSYNIFAAEGSSTMSYTVEASTKILYRRLARFIRVIDYMLFQLRVTIIHNSYTNVILTK
jgi:hypothetical protein